MLTKLIATPQFKEYYFPERVYHNLGLALQEIGKERKALAFYRKGVSENPSYIPSLIEMGLLYKRQKNWSKSLDSFRVAMDFCTTCYEPLAQYAGINHRIGRKEAASQALLNYLKRSGISSQDKLAATQLLQELEFNSPKPVPVPVPAPISR